MAERNLLVFLRFDGRRLHGWQVQKNAPTAMSVFQEALEGVLGEQVQVKGCSRTDAGVHAARYGVSFRTNRAIPCQGLVRALNGALPPEMAALSCREVPLDFHARYAARGKRYLYRILNSEIPDPFLEGLAYRVSRPLDVEKMHRAAQAFPGTRDWSAFRNRGGADRDPVRTIFSAGVERRGDLIVFSVEGDGFLYNMVRIMAGTLIEIGRGTLSGDSLPRIISGGDREAAGFTAPACGLILDDVFYDLPERGEKL